MKESEINWKSGKIVFWGIDDLGLNKNLESKIEGILREDLIMVEFGNKIVLDLSWLPEFSPQGQFVLNVVRCKHGNSEDWENPLFQLKFRDLGNLIQNLNQAIQVAEEASRS